MDTKFRCRKCRYLLFNAEHLLTPKQTPALEYANHDSDIYHKESDILKKVEDDGCSVTLWYLAQQDAPEWVNAALIEEGFKKGKLKCPQCSGRVGAFDFLTPVKCRCGDHFTPSIRVAKNRVDLSCRGPQLPTMATVAMDLKVDQVEEENDSPLLDNVHDQFSAINNEKCDSTINSEKLNGAVAKDNEESLPIVSQPTAIVTENHSESSGVLMCSAVVLPQASDTELPTASVANYDSASEDSDAREENSLALELAAEIPIEGAEIAVDCLETIRSEEVDLQNADNHDQDESGSVTSAQAAVEMSTAALEMNSDLQQNSDHNDNRFSALENEEVAAEEEQLAEQEPCNDVSAGSLPDLCDGTSASTDISDLDALTCSVCLELFFIPHGCEPCHHVFCDPCLRRLKLSTPVETRCPLCRTIIAKCLPRHDLDETIRSVFPVLYSTRHAMEQRQHRQLPSLPNATSGRSLRSILRQRRRGNRNNNNTLTVIAQFAFFVLLVMFAFTIFATTVGYLLWYFLELSMDIALDLMASINNFWDYLYQAMIVWSINGHIPPKLKEMLSGSVSDMTNTYNKFSDRMKELWVGGDQYRHQFMGHLRYHMTNGTNELLSKVQEAQVANYIILACLSTFFLYRLARYVQRIQERLAV